MDSFARRQLDVQVRRLYHKASEIYTGSLAKNTLRIGLRVQSSRALAESNRSAPRLIGTGAWEISSATPSAGP